jgi:hypothetical protein
MMQNSQGPTLLLEGWADEKPIGTNERESLLKLVIGMARDSYNSTPD